MMKHILHFTALFIAACLILIVEAANAQLAFQKTFGRDSSDYGYSVQQTTDGGYIISGATTSFGAGGKDCYLIKTDSIGDTLWTRTYGSTNWEIGYVVQQTTDGGYIVLGGSGDFSLLKIDSNGDPLWTKKYKGGGANWDVGNSVQQTTDGGYIITGLTDTALSQIVFKKEVYLIKTDVNGDTLWTKKYGEGAGGTTNYGNSVQQTTDGGYIITGYTDTSGFLSTTSNVYLIKTDANGDTLWTKTYGGNSLDYGCSVRQTVDGGYIITGSVSSFGAGMSDVYLIKTDASGDTLWTKTYGGINDESGFSVQQTTDGGYIVAGTTNSFGAGATDVYLIKTDANGDTLWTKSYGGVFYDRGNSVQQTTDGGYVIIGSTNTFGGPWSSNIYFIKTDANGNSGCNEYNTNTILGNTTTIINSGAIVRSGGIVDTFTVMVNNTETMTSDACAINDSVWPGDANYDMVVNNIDLLPIGIAYAANGPYRPYASIFWEGQVTYNWIDSLNNGINYKHVDCNGDGTIDFADTVAITLNYGFTHTKNATPNIASPADPDFYLDMVTDTVLPNTPLNIDLNLGTIDIPADSIYGLAFTLNFDPLLVDSASINISVSNSWLGTPGTDMIKLDRKLYNNGKVDVGIVRIDQNNSSGYGKICEIDITPVNNFPTDEMLTMTISDVTVIANDESIRNVNLGADSVIVLSNVSIDQSSIGNDQIILYPNPAVDEFIIKGNYALLAGLEMYDVTGRLIHQYLLNNNQSTIDVRGFARGMYVYVAIGEDKTEMGRGKLVIE